MAAEPPHITVLRFTNEQATEFSEGATMRISCTPGLEHIRNQAGTFVSPSSALAYLGSLSSMHIPTRASYKEAHEIEAHIFIICPQYQIQVQQPDPFAKVMQVPQGVPPPYQ